MNTKIPLIGTKILSVEMRGCQATERHNEEWGVVLDVKMMVLGSAPRQYLTVLVAFDDGGIHCWPIDKFVYKDGYYEYQY